MTRSLGARLSLVLVALAAVVLTACGQVATVDPPAGDVIVITTGSDAPASLGSRGVSRLGTLQGAVATLAGSASQPVVLKPSGDLCDVPAERTIALSFTVQGQLQEGGSFNLPTQWTWNGTSFDGSNVQTISLAIKTTGAATPRVVSVTVSDPTRLGSGDGSFVVTPTDLSPATGGGNVRLDSSTTMSATIYYEFESCGTANTAPLITVPNDLTVEATSSSGATVLFSVTADDDQDGNLTNFVVCSVGSDIVASGDTFPIGASKVECSVTDAGDLTSDGDFYIYVQDTTAPVFTAIPTAETLVAADINGAAIDLSALTITAKDWNADGVVADGEVSPPVTVSCVVGTEDADGFLVALGQTVTVSCTATDSASYRAPVEEGQTAPAAPNVSAASTFDVLVGLDLSGTCGFKSPLRNDAPFSAHKLNSTVPHKICPPAYADGTLATDLAPHLRLELQWQGGTPPVGHVEANDFAAGSTAWRYDDADGHYIFNVKTARSWNDGSYVTTVSAFFIDLAQTELVLRR